MMDQVTQAPRGVVKAH